MEERKRLKKLVLKKEEIVNLNDYQMKQMKGGTNTPAISKLSKFSFEYFLSHSVDQVIDYVDNYMIENSWYTCAPDPQVSKEYYMGGCLIPEVVVRP